MGFGYGKVDMTKYGNALLVAYNDYAKREGIVGRFSNKKTLIEFLDKREGILTLCSAPLDKARRLFLKYTYDCNNQTIGFSVVLISENKTPYIHEVPLKIEAFLKKLSSLKREDFTDPYKVLDMDGDDTARNNIKRILDFAKKYTDDNGLYEAIISY